MGFHADWELHSVEVPLDFTGQSVSKREFRHVFIENWDLYHFSHFFCFWKLDTMECTRLRSRQNTCGLKESAAVSVCSLQSLIFKMVICLAVLEFGAGVLLTRH